MGNVVDERVKLLFVIRFLTVYGRNNNLRHEASMMQPASIVLARMGKERSCCCSLFNKQQSSPTVGATSMHFAHSVAIAAVGVGGSVEHVSTMKLCHSVDNKNVSTSTQQNDVLLALLKLARCSALPLRNSLGR